MNTKRVTIGTIFFLFILLIAVHPAFAAIPTTLDYQGFLTDTSGVPEDGPVSIEFHFYNVELGGLSLWSETHMVTVNQGVFSVELGATIPFPIDLFGQPLWLGLTVESDAEMLPRRSVSSTAYSFKAQDANTLEGASASSLDQSAHITDTANPHNVTAAQVGAISGADLANHAADTSAHHVKTTSFTDLADTATDAQIPNNITIDQAANATYAASAGNASTVDGFSAGSSPVANQLLALDGSGKFPNSALRTGTGNGLDADKVDGLQASELIDAAQDEVRTPIDHVPFDINSSGSYYFTGNLTGGGINVNADYVTIDLMGFTLNGNALLDDYGFEINANNVEIRNGSVTNFLRSGIGASDISRNITRVFNMRIISTGIGPDSYTGIDLNNNSMVRDCIVMDSRGPGIYVREESTVVGNIIEGNGSFGVFGSEGALIANNVVRNNASYGIKTSDGAMIINNTVSNNTGTGIVVRNGNTVTGNTVKENGDWGISGQLGNAFVNNTVRANTTGGLYSFVGIIKDNSVIGNGTGIKSNDNGSSIINNTVKDNQHQGIYAGAGTTIKDNTVFNNNVSDTVGEGGIRGGDGSTITGNTVRTSKGNGITSGNKATITGNTVTDNTHWGIYAGSATIKDNSVFANNTSDTSGEGGINTGDGATITGNTVRANNGNGITSGNKATITGNTVTDNTHWGVYAAGNATIKDNSVFANNTSDTPDQGGIYIYFGAQVKGNSVVDNKQNNIYIIGRYNTIEENLLIGSVNGINFQSDHQNVIGNNRLSNHTSNYLNKGTNVDLGNNTEF